MSSKKRITLRDTLSIGGGEPISVQTMTNTKTEDTAGTIQQIESAVQAGCDIIRVSCPSREAAVSLGEIIRNTTIPVIADIHFDYRLAMMAIENGAHCIRINPANIDESGIRKIVDAAKDTGCAIRIGINSGSIERSILQKYKEPNADAMVESAVVNANKLEDLGFENFKISVKSSDVRESVRAYRKLAQLVDYPLHIGITEAGPVFPGSIKSAIGIGALLMDGVGDTIRVSLTGDILDEIRVGRQILKSLGMLKDSINIVSCPTCSRTLIDVVAISNELEAMAEDLRIPLKISVLGCVVNGPGEAMTADIGIFGFQEEYAKIIVRGVEYGTFHQNKVIEEVKKIIESFYM
ncbi:MAG: flavodoxin-dependent (E)-4-hydroxy-3-methylbut-2-enyl-diphosphate synthase [Holosporales bacterium]|nr:flavodoxin-dependent (E)-4-hydroxy-3-methylbut-2-enyl-diphosphate synthase [Holosporales bacterium]